MNKYHKEAVENCKNKLNLTHVCEMESKIFRNGEIHFLGLECHPNKNNLTLFKPTAIEVEDGSSKLQRESNLADLQEWKRKNTDGEIFQIEDSDQLDISKLKKGGLNGRKNMFKRSFQTRFKRTF